MKKNNIQEDLLIGQLKPLVLKAGAAILDIYENADSFGVEAKADQSPLTIADKKSNAIICTGLEQFSAPYPIISEENKAIPYEERKNFHRFWLVDPLDGTKEFVKRNGEFTVNVALVENGRPILGMVYAPVLEELFWAVKGQGAFLEKNNEQQKLTAASFQLDEAGLKVVCSRSHLDADTQAFVDQLQSPELTPKGSSLKFLILARGQAHLYPRMGPTMEWDTGAAQIILEEAGGQVVDQETKEPLRYNKESLLNPYFVAYGQMK